MYKTRDLPLYIPAPRRSAQ